jgi:hypothetical protein
MKRSIGPDPPLGLNSFFTRPIRNEYEVAELLLSCFLSDKHIKVIGPKDMIDRTSVISADFSSKDNAQVAYELFLDAGIET